MATSSRKSSRVFFRSKEGTAGTRDTFAFFEGRSMTFDFPSSQYMKEMDDGKLGAGEHGTVSEVQSVFTPISIPAQRMSEILYLLSYCTGKTDVVASIGSGVYSHELKQLGVASRTMPTFSFEYGNQAASACDSFNHAVINDLSMTLASGGNGVVDFTANGFANLHYDNSGTLTRNATVDNSSFVGSYDFRGEPLVNFKCCRVWMSSGLETTPLVQGSIDFTGSDLSGTPTELTSFVNSLTFTYNNGMSGEELMRAGGCGILNNQDRGERAITLELALRKSEDFDTKALQDTQQAIEILFQGPVISGGGGSNRFAMKVIFPVVNFGNIAQDGGSPIVETIPCEVHEDTNRDVFYCYAQNGVDQGINTTISTSKSSSSSSSSSSESTVSSSSSS